VIGEGSAMIESIFHDQDLALDASVLVLLHGRFSLSFSTAF
jgi:hypothetical protein